MSGGWTESAAAWIADMGEHGDYGRRYILDPAMNERLDLVEPCMTLVDIPDASAAICEMARVLAPGGTLLIANSNSFNTAGTDLAWNQDDENRRRHCAIDRYMEEREQQLEWRNIRIKNHHRPLCFYMSRLIASGLTLTHFDEPTPRGGDPAKAEKYVRAPWFLIMEWRKPETPATV